MNGIWPEPWPELPRFKPLAQGLAFILSGYLGLWVGGDVVLGLGGPVFEIVYDVLNGP